MTPTAVVRPLPGPGLVARSGDLLLVCADGATGTEELIGLVAEVAAAGGDGGLLVRRVAALLAADFAGNFPACAASGPTPDGRLAVLVHGTATARVVGGDGEVSLTAADAITSVNRLVPGPISAVRLELPGAGEPSQLARLEAGVVSAAGVVTGGSLDAVSRLAPADASYAAPAVPPAQASAPAAESDRAWSASSMMDKAIETDWPPRPAAEPPVPFPLTMPPPSADLAPPAAPPGLDPLPVREPLASSPYVAVTMSGGEVEASAPPVDVRPTVLGLACPNGHLNDPSVATCITCGTSLASVPPTLREGPRPPLGVLAIDDGSAFVLDMGYVLGREPQHDPEVLSGAARPLKIADADGVVSRRHVRVALVGWDVQVIDLGSANGTFVQFPGDPNVQQLTAHHPVVVRPGAQITMGRRWFRIESLAPDAGRS